MHRLKRILYFKSAKVSVTFPLNNACHRSSDPLKQIKLMKFRFRNALTNATKQFVSG